MAFSYLNTLKKIKEQQKQSNNVFVVEDEKGTKVNQERYITQKKIEVIHDKIYPNYFATPAERANKKQDEPFRSVITYEPIPYTSSTKKDEEEDKKWYQKILQVPDVFDDGYQFGDVTKTIGGTVADVGLGFTRGIANVGEGLGDAMTYGVAQVFDWTGNDKKANQLRENASEDIINKAYKKPQNFVDQASVIGDTGDKVTEGLGYMATIWAGGTIGGAAGTAIGGTAKAGTIGSTIGQSSVIMGNSTGTNMADIYQEYGADGVKSGEAWAKSLGGAAIETVTEQLFGMFGHADTALVNAMSGRAKSALGKALVRLGGQAVGEGSEEIISYAGNYVLDRVVDAASKGEGATFAKQWSWEDMWEQAGIAAITALASGGGTTSASVISNKNSTNNWSDAFNETMRQQDVGGQVESLENEINKLNKQIEKTTDTTALQELQTELDWKQKQLDALQTNPNAFSNIAPVDNKAQVEGLQSAIEEKTQELERSQDAREKQIIQEQINNLQEELNEVTNAQQITDETNLKQQAFVYEANENDSDIKKAVYESASKLMNNTKEAHTLVDVVAKIAEDRGTAYEFTNNKALKEAGHKVGNNTINGLVTEDGKVLINLDSNKSLTTVLGHETTHLLEGTQEYEALKKTVIEYAKQKGIYQETFDRISNLYQGTNANVDNEITSDLVGELLFTDKSFVENLSVQQPNVFQKIYNYIKHIYKMATAGSQEAKQLEKIKYQFDQAWKKQGKEIKEGVKYSTSENTESRNLITQHNITEEKLSQSLELGGLPVPSIAISNANYPLLNFGGVTLLFDKNTIDPSNKKNKVYNADVYSPRFPKVDVVINETVFNEIGEKLVNEGYSRSRLYQVEDLIKENRLDINNAPDELLNVFLKENGLAFTEQNRDLYENGEKNAEYREWLKQLANNATLKKRIEKSGVDPFYNDGRRKPDRLMYLDYTLENIVKEMTKKRTTGSENSIITSGKIRANMAKQYKSISEIQDDRNNVISREDMQKFIDDSTNKYDEIVSSIAPAYKYWSEENSAWYNRSQAFDNVAEALNETAKSKQITIEKFKAELQESLIDISKVSEEQLQVGVDWLNSLKNMPTEYFEAKPQRVVSFDEVKTAIVPDDISQQLIEQLQEKGIEVLTYEDEKQRAELIKQQDSLRFSLSSQNEEIAPTGGFNIYGKDVKLQVEEAIAPLQETINNLTEQVQELSAQKIAEKPTQPTLEEVQNLMDIRDNKSGSEYASAFFALRDKYGQAELYKSLNEYYSTGTVTQPSNVENIDLAPVSQDIVEQQGQEAFEHITDEQAPSFEDIADEAMWNETFESEPESKVQSPFDERDIDEVGNRKVKAYQYENPEVRPFFQTEAQNMIYDLDNTIKGEKGVAIDELGNMEYYGISRQTTEAIAYLKDNYGYSYEQIRKGLNDIIEDNGKENNAVAKRIEFMLDERLREGYTTSDGIPIPANQEYINFLNERQITEYNKEAFNALTEQDIPLNIIPEPQETPKINQNTKTEQTIPMKRITAQNGNTDVSKGKQRKWIKTSTESEVVNREILPDDLDQKKIMYQPISNKATLGKANSRLDTLGYEKSVEYFNNQILNNKVTVEDIAMGERLIQEALRQGDKKTAGDLIQNVAILGTELGQKVQALSIIQRMTPEGQLKMLEKTINRGKVKGDKAFTDVNLTDDMKKKILDTYNDDGSYNKEALDKAVEDVKQDIAEQMKVTAMDKINEWRYLSMLGNPKTHIRNLISNVAMKGTVAVKNAVARTIETVAPIENRTKTWRPSSQVVSDFAKQTAVEMKDVISGDSKYNETADIKAKRDIFKNKILKALSNFNSDLLEKEDWWFSKGAFENSFKEFLTANGITTQEDIQNNPELVEKGKLYATEQAQIATFRQYSWLANKIGEMERKNAATQIAVGSIVPFKKTPVNIAKTGLSYSPLGFAKTLTYDMVQVKKGNMEASTLIDHIAQNTVGSALTLVGYMLAKAGILNGAGDDDKEGEYDYQLGKQAYSLNIGGNTYSLSWLTPVAMPMFVGANAYEQLEEGKEWNGDVVLETLAQTLDPLSEMSFLSSLDTVLSSYDSGIQKFAGIGESMIQNYATQFIPTASSQLAATLDDTKRTTKVSGDSTMKIIDETYNKLIYKIPGLRETLEPTTDIWGNEVKQSESLLQRAFENFISPYARKESIATEIDEELKDLFSQTGDNGILPSIPYNYVNFDGEKYKMSAEEYTEYKKTYGQTANDLLEDLFRTTTYQRATSEERTEMVNRVYDYARDEAKLEYLGKEGVDYTNAKEDDKDVYKENLIKGAIENDMSVDEYELYVDDPEEYSFLKEKDYSYRRKYFDTNNSLKEIEESFENQKEGVDDDDELDVLYSEKKTSIINSIVDSGLEDTEKASLYKKYYNTDTVDTIMKSAISIDDYLTYETKEFKADKNAKGNSIPNSRKNKVIDYVNTLDMSIAEKAILIKSTNTFKFNDYNNEIIDYVIELDLTYEEKKAILEDLDMTVDDEGYIHWED